MPATSVYTMMKHAHDDAPGTSLDSLSTEMLFLIAEHAISDAHALLESEAPYQNLVPYVHYVPLPPPPTLSLPPITHPPTTLSDALPSIDQMRCIPQPPPPLPPPPPPQFNQQPTVQQGYSVIITSLFNLALTSRRYRAIAQEVLYRAPVPRSDLPWTDSSPIFQLACTLLSSPHLARHINTLRLDMPRDWGTEMIRSAKTTAIVAQAESFIEGIDWMLPQGKEGWIWQLRRLRPLPFLALILSLSPNLKKLSLVAGTDEVEDDIIPRMFWSTSGTSMSDFEYYSSLERMASCPGLAGLRHLRTGSAIPITTPPFVGLETLTSLDLVLNDWPYGTTVPVLQRIKTLRLNTCLARLPREEADATWWTAMGGNPQTRTGGLSFLYMSIAQLLESFPELEKLELYAGAAYTEHMLARTTRDQEHAIDYKQYDTLIDHLQAVTSSLKRLELPRGWWTAPRLKKVNMPDETSQPGANTGTIADISAFTRLQTYITHSTAILVKGLDDTGIADPEETLPSSVKEIVVYGAHDGLWSWINDILDGEESYFKGLGSIELRREEPVHAELRLSTLGELRESQPKIWEKLQWSKICVWGDV